MIVFLHKKSTLLDLYCSLHSRMGLPIQSVVMHQALRSYKAQAAFGCSMNFWPPEYERAGGLYQAFLDKPVCDPEVMLKHFQNSRGDMHTDRRGDKISAAGWQLAVYAVWCVESESEPGRLIERGHHRWIQCVNFHSRTEEAARPCQAKVILMSVLRLCFKNQNNYLVRRLQPVPKSDD